MRLTAEVNSKNLDSRRNIVNVRHVATSIIAISLIVIASLAYTFFYSTGCLGVINNLVIYVLPAQRGAQREGGLKL